VGGGVGWGWGQEEGGGKEERGWEGRREREASWGGEGDIYQFNE